MSDRIGQIKARLAAATPGPWDSMPDVVTGQPNWILGRTASPDDGYYGTTDVLRIADENLDGSYLSDEDANFIAHTPEDIAYLLAELAGAERRIEAALAFTNEWSSPDASRMRAALTTKEN